MRPIELAPNQPPQFYRGGSVLSAFRGTPALDAYRPEDWVASTTLRHGATGTEGLTRLANGQLLRDAVLADPVAWLGSEHADALGADPALLVKLLDAQERLPVHVHPNRGFARRHLGCRSGKTEAWVVIGAKGSQAQVHVGFTRDIEDAELERWITTQDSAALLGSLHAFDVAPGDTVLVPAGLPHAIGGGIFCLELQEATDFSMMLEWEGFEGLDPGQVRLGLDADVARECVQRKALGEAALEQLRRSAAAPSSGMERLFPAEADGFFRAERIRSAAAAVELDAGFAILVVLEGEGDLHTQAGETLALARGGTILIPFAAGQTTITGDVVAVRCRPPSVQAALAGGLGEAL